MRTTLAKRAPSLTSTCCRGTESRAAWSRKTPYLTLNSRISIDLEAGSYTIEATTYSALKSGDFTLSVQVATPVHRPEPGEIPEPRSALKGGDGSPENDESWRGIEPVGGGVGATDSDPVPGGGIYTWRDGDRVMQVQLVSETPIGSKSAGGPGAKDAAPGGRDSESAPVFRSELGGNQMTLPGGVLLVLDSSWTKSEVDRFFSSNGIDSSRASELGFLANAFLVETDPGFPSLDLANALADQAGVEISSPNWRSELETSQATSVEEADDHGDSIDAATDLPLDTAVHGVIGEEGDAMTRDQSHHWSIEPTAGPIETALARTPFRGSG